MLSLNVVPSRMVASMKRSLFGTRQSIIGDASSKKNEWGGWGNRRCSSRGSSFSMHEMISVDDEI